jgi:hypothetical protein
MDSGDPIRGRGGALFLAVVAVTLVVRAGVMVAEHNSLPEHVRMTLANDAARYHVIAESPGTPYRDFEVEVPPVAYGLIEAINGSTARDTALRLGWSQWILDVLVAILIAIGWGRRTTLAYLVLSMPLAFFLYFHIDLLSIALTVGALVLIRKRRERSGGVVLSLAVVAKIWPLAVVPLLLVQRRRRALVWFGTCLVAGVGAWIAWGGLEGPRQVLTFRGAHGWQIESLVGAIVWVFSSVRSHLLAGAVRVGSAPAWALGLLLVVLIGLVSLAWRLGLRDRERAEGMPALVAVTAVLVASPLLSPQFVSWLVPFAAIAVVLSGEVMLGALTLVVTSLTAVTALTQRTVARHSWAGQGPLLARNVVLVLLLVAGFRALSRLRSPG